MEHTTFRFTRLDPEQKLRTSDLAALFNSSDVGREQWLLVSPHDDDLCMGSGLLMQAAVLAGVDVQVLVVTDGCQGYCTMADRERIVPIRLAETHESFRILGVEDRKVHSIGYPDGGLFPFQGRRAALHTEISIEGYIGLQNAFTYFLRKLRPHRVFVPTPTDLHPDHQITHSELMISLFHAGGSIWPELGPPLEEFPKPYELAVYCDFLEPPNIEIVGPPAAFSAKLNSIAAYKSQAQIAALVENVRQSGPYEYLREVAFRLYSPSIYRARFE